MQSYTAENGRSPSLRFGWGDLNSFSLTNQQTSRCCTMKAVQVWSSERQVARAYGSTGRLQEILAAKGGTTWARNGRWILPENARLQLKIQGSFTCRKCTAWTDGFTSPPKEDVLRIFSPWKIQRLRSGLKPRTWVPKASTLPLDHRSRYIVYLH